LRLSCSLPLHRLGRLRPLKRVAAVIGMGHRIEESRDGRPHYHYRCGTSGSRHFLLQPSPCDPGRSESFQVERPMVSCPKLAALTLLIDRQIIIGFYRRWLSWLWWLLRLSSLFLRWLRFRHRSLQDLPFVAVRT